MTEDSKTIGKALDATLKELREVFHRSGRLGQHELLDEVSKLVFAHLVDIESGGSGISVRTFGKTTTPASDLKKFVEQVFSRHLPPSLSSGVGLSEYRLLLKPKDNKLASEIIEAFGQLSDTASVKLIRDSKSVDLLNDVFGKFLSDSFVDEKEMGQYLTPREVIRYMTRLGIESLSREDVDALTTPNSKVPDIIIMDPSCGVGSFLVEVVHELFPLVSKKDSTADTKVWLESFMKNNLVGMDKSTRMLKLATTNLGIYGAPLVNLHAVNSLARSGSDGKITQGMEGRVKLILTNPPFGAEIKGADLGKYHIATDWSDKELKKVDSEILFLERYIDWLSPGGILVTVVPDSILTNKGVFSRLRKALAPLVEIISVTSLPRVAFAAAGTNAKTSVLQFRKREDFTSNREVKFAVSNSLGFDVVTRGSQKVKVYKGINDLENILPAMLSSNPSGAGIVSASLDASVDRWDAMFHGSASEGFNEQLEALKQKGIKVGDLAVLAKDRQNPKKLSEELFDYIEISDVSPGAVYASSKKVPCQDAPGRARRLVRKGDVLVSTVRPERRSIAIVPESLDGAICSTGFAVLRAKGISPLLLARLLATDFANAQIMKNNSGIAYPVIDENCLTDVVLPIEREDVVKLQAHADRVEQTAHEHKIANESFDEKINRSVSRLVRI